MSDLDPSTLSPGIRRMVMLLREAGFNTTDSGDGKSNAGMDCAFNYPNIHIVCNPSQLVAKADDLNRLLKGLGIIVGGDYEGPTIQASYNPIDGKGVVSLFYVDDSFLGDES